MSDAQAGQGEQYRAALQDYVLGGGGEAALQRAYECGRQALVGGMNLLEITAMHHAAMLSCVLGPLLQEQAQRLSALGEEVLAQVLVPFEIVNRGVSEANMMLRKLNEQLSAVNQQLQQEQARAESLLLNVLPQPIAERLKREPTLIADKLDEVTVLFADIANFTRLSTLVPSDELIGWLNEVISVLDRLAEAHGLEKIKTIGDGYMLAGGVPTPRADHAEAVAEVALDILSMSRQMTTPNGQRLSMRLGINSGPVVAGVIGTKKFAYDLWGETVNVASRMESLGRPGRIHVSPMTYERLQKRYVFKKRGTIWVRGKGSMITYFLTGRKTDGCD